MFDLHQNKDRYVIFNHGVCVVNYIVTTYSLSAQKKKWINLRGIEYSRYLVEIINLC